MSLNGTDYFAELKEKYKTGSAPATQPQQSGSSTGRQSTGTATAGRTDYFAELKKKYGNADGGIAVAAPQTTDSTLTDWHKGAKDITEEAKQREIGKQIADVISNFPQVKRVREQDKKAIEDIKKQATPSKFVGMNVVGTMGGNLEAENWDDKVDAVKRLIRDGKDADYAVTDALLKQLKTRQSGQDFITQDDAILQNYYDTVLFTKQADILAKTKMDGKDYSVLEELQRVARMDGEEKKKRKTAVLKKMEELGIDPKNYAIFSGDSNFTLGNFGNMLGWSALSGLSGAWEGLASTADFFVGKPLQNLGWENNPISEAHEFWEGEHAYEQAKASLYTERLGGGKGWQFTSDVVGVTFGAIPDALMAYATAGASAPNLASKASYETVGNGLARAGLKAEQMMRNPNYWTSFARTVGNDYEEAKERGASDTVATLGAILTSLVNAGIETGVDGGSGIQGLTDDLAKNKNTLWAFVESIAEESGEEGLQKFVSEIVTKVAYDQDAEILKPKEYARDMALGGFAAIGLGGLQTGSKIIADSYNQLQANKEQMLKEVIDEVLGLDVSAPADVGAVEQTQKNTTQTSGNKYHLRGYSQQQKENWRSSKRIVLYEGIEQFKNFIKNALSGKIQTNKKLYFGAIDSDLASAISRETGVNVEGYNLALGENEIRKINKDHGNEQTEAPRGQRAVTEADYLSIPDVVQSPDSIKLSSKLYEGKPVIEFRKTNGNETTVVSAVVSDKRLDLFVQTTYVNKKRGSIATPESEQADSNTPKATGGTAPNKDVTQTPAEGQSTNHETNARSASVSPSSNNSIPQTVPGVNTNSAQHPNPTDSMGAAPESPAVDAGLSNISQSAVGNPRVEPGEKRKVSKIYSNTYANASGEGTQIVGEVAKLADPDIDKYDPITERESVAKAVTRAQSDIDYEYDNLLSKSGWTGEDNDTAMFVLNHLRKTGDVDRLRQLARKQREEGTRGGQLAQSFAKYSRMTATDCVIDAVEELENMTASDVPKFHYKADGFDAWRQKTIAAIVDIANQIDGVADGDIEGMKDIIRSLANFRKTTAWFGLKSNLTKIAEGALENIDFDTAKAVANAQLSTIPHDFVKRSVGQVAKTIRIHNMLSALTTVNRNVFGNAAIGVVDAISDSTVGLALDSLVSLVTKKRTVGNDVTHAKTYFSAGAKAANLAALCVELDIPMDSESRFTTGHTRTYSPQGNPVMRFLSAYEKCMKYALEVTDQFFDGGTNAAVEKSLEKLVAKGKLTDEDATALSQLAGKRRTFKDDRMLTRAAKGIKEGLNEIGSGNIGAGDIAMPFAGTGSNVGHVAVDYSTFGLSGLVDIFRLMYDVKAGKYNKDGIREYRKNGEIYKTVSLAEVQRKAVTNAARGLTGVGLVAAFAAFASAGILKVHDDEDKDKRGLDQAMNLSGAQLNLSAWMRSMLGQSAAWQEDDLCLSVDFLEPFNAQMYLGYLLSQEDSVQGMIKAYPGAAVRSVWQSLLDMPLMQGLSEISDTVTNLGSTVPEGEDIGWKDTVTEVGGQVVGSIASSFIPSYIRQAAQVIDPYYRDTTGETAGEKAINQLLATIPFASTTLPKKYSGLGQEQRRYDDLLPGILNTFVNPGELEQIKSSDVYEYLNELSERTGDVTFFPANAAPGSFTMDGEKVTVSGKDATESYQLTYGTNVNRLYGELIQNADFRNAPDDLQADILNDAKAYAVMLAKAEVSDYSDVPAYIKNRASGLSEAEAILRHALIENSKGDAVYRNTKKYTYLSVSDADYIADLLEGLTAQTDKVSAVAGSKLSEKDQKAVLKDTLSDSAYAKYLRVLALGLDTDDYASSYSTYREEKDSGGKGTKDRTIEKFSDEYDMTYEDAKKLYEIYCPPAK